MECTYFYPDISSVPHWHLGTFACKTVPMPAEGPWIIWTGKPREYAKNDDDVMAWTHALYTLLDRCGGIHCLPEDSPHKARVSNAKHWCFPCCSPEQTLELAVSSGIILCMRPANERRHYSATSSLIGRAQTQNDPWIYDVAMPMCRHCDKQYKAKQNKIVCIFYGIYCICGQALSLSFINTARSGLVIQFPMKYCAYLNDARKFACQMSFIIWLQDENISTLW